MPLRILRVRGLINASLVRGFLVTGDVLDVLPRHALSRARPPLQRPARPARPSCPGRSPSRCSRRASRRGSSRCSGRSASQAGMASAAAGLLAVRHASARTPPSSRRLLRLLRDRPRHRQRVHAAPDARDGGRPGRRRRARVRDHQRLPADHWRARTCRPQHGRRQPHQGAAVRRRRARRARCSAATTSPSSPVRPPSSPGSSSRSRSCGRATRSGAAARRRLESTASPPNSPWRSKPHDPDYRRHPGRVSDGVVASYIHDISHGRARPTAHRTAGRVNRAAWP